MSFVYLAHKDSGIMSRGTGSDDAVALGTADHQEKVMSRLTEIFPDGELPPPTQCPRTAKCPLAHRVSHDARPALEDPGSTPATDHGCQSRDREVESRIEEGSRSN